MDPYTDWIVVISAVIMTAATVALARYAYVTIEEGKKDRRKDTIEKQLENVYTPIYEILRLARDRGQPLDSSTWAVSKKELERIDKIIATFGHYFGRDDLERFRKTLQRGKEEPAYKETMLYQTAEINDAVQYIEKRRKDLMTELEELTAAPNSG